MISEYIGAKLSEIRAQRGETIASISRSLDVSPDSVRRWESGAERVPAEMLVEFALLLHCRISDFFGGYSDVRKRSDDFIAEQVTKRLDG